MFRKWLVVNTSMLIVLFSAQARALLINDAAVLSVGSSYIEDGVKISQPGSQAGPLTFFGTQEFRFPGSTALFNNTLDGVGPHNGFYTYGPTDHVDSFVFHVDHMAVHRVVAPTTVPEPATLALLGVGLVTMGLRRRRRFHSTVARRRAT